MALDSILLTQAFDRSEEVRDEAREEIINTHNVDHYYECITRARDIKSADDLEFWLLEVLTSQNEISIIARSVLELAQEVLIPQERLNEALVYLKYVRKSTTGEIDQTIQRLINTLKTQVQESTQIQSTDDWKDYDISKRITTGMSQQHYYDRFLCYFHTTNDVKREELVEDFQYNFLSKITGFFIGLSGSILEYGVKRDTAVRAFMDFIEDAYPDFNPEPLREHARQVFSHAPENISNNSISKIKEINNSKFTFDIN